MGRVKGMKNVRSTTAPAINLKNHLVGITGDGLPFLVHKNK